MPGDGTMIGTSTFGVTGLFLPSLIQEFDNRSGVALSGFGITVAVGFFTLLSLFVFAQITISFRS